METSRGQLNRFNYYNAHMAISFDCRHYSTRTMANGDQVQRCRMDAAEQTPFACPENCLFFEERSITDAGWQRFGDQAQ